MLAHMNPEATHPSLLSRVRDPANAAAWREFEDRYRELLVRFCRKRGLQQADAEDVAQIVFFNLSKALPGFTYDPGRGRFRDYLYRSARNAIAQWSSRPKHVSGALGTDIGERVEAPGTGNGPSGEDAAWEQEWVAHHYRLAMETVRRTFDPKSVEMFERNMAGVSVAALAAAYDTTEQAVHKVRQRVRARMEEIIARQIREEDGLDD
jgi:RNA polymerase sigma-70 factor (ECF subfamily)